MKIPLFSRMVCKTEMSKFLVLLLISIFFTGFASATHYINGYVNESYSGRSPNNELAFLWNFSDGKVNNLTDIIGVNGNSGSPNTYQIDCDLLEGGCSEGDVLSVQVIDNSSYIENGEYVPLSRIKNVTVSSNDSDWVEDIRLNSPPSVENIHPENNSYENSDIKLNCSYNDLDSDILNMSMYANFSGFFQKVNSSQDSYSGELAYYSNENDGFYSFYCKADDDLAETSSDETYFTIDSENPVINYFDLNKTKFCGESSIRLNCSVSEDNLEKVYFEIETPSSSKNLSSNYYNGYYYADFGVNETGDYSSKCVAEDKSGNKGYSEAKNFYSLEELPDLTAGKINFSESSPIEGQEMEVSVFVNNTGCVSSEKFYTGFYEGIVQESNLLSTKPLNLEAYTGSYLTFSFITKIGKTNYSFFADYNSSISEISENNNKNSSIFEVSAWQNFYGKIDAFIKLADTEYALRSWGNTSNFEGNIFVADYESNIDWTNLYAIEKTISETSSSNDYSEIDQILGMSDYSDSVSDTYSSPEYKDYVVSGRNITDVPAITSISGSPFYTGILWDGSDDQGNEEFDSTDKEDLVFITQIQKEASCTRGDCDYEIKIPAKLREFETSEDSEKVYLYHELE